MNSEKTQITRKTVSAPMRWIADNIYFSHFDDILHFGEGKAFADTVALEVNGYPYVVAFDPNSPHVWKRDRCILNPEFYTYTVGVSIYVFNTLLPAERAKAFEDMFACCERCVIAVRTDKVKGSPALGYDGVTTKRGTFQTQLNAGAWMEWFKRMSPEWASVEVLHKTSNYVIIDIKRK